MDCPIFKEMIYLYHYDVLEEEERAEMDRHLAICATCRNLEKQTDKAIDLLGKWQITNAGRELPEKTLRKISLKGRPNSSAPSPSQGTRSTSGLSVLRWAGIAAALIMSAVLFFIPPRHESDYQSISQAPDAPAGEYGKPAKDECAPAAENTCRRDLPESPVGFAVPGDVPCREEPAKTGVDLEGADREEKEADDETYARYGDPLSPVEFSCPGEAMADKTEEAPPASESRQRAGLTSIVKRAVRKLTGEEVSGQLAKSDLPETKKTMPAAALPKAKAAGCEDLFKEDDAFAERPFSLARENPVSTFPLAVEIESYTTCRSLIQRGILPPREEVRIEEFINYFDYGYPHPQGENVFAVSAEMATCPWKTSNLLLNIGIRGKSEGKPEFPIAREASARIEFDPDYVRAYRLIGYEKTPKGFSSSSTASQEHDSAPGAEEIYAGHTVTVLYEIVPETNTNAPWDKHQRAAVRAYAEARADRLLTMQLRYKRPGVGKGEVMEIVQTGIFHPRPSRNFDWSAAVAGFAMILRNSEYKGNISYELVLELAQGATGTDAPGHRGEFLRLVTMAKILAGE